MIYWKKIIHWRKNRFVIKSEVDLRLRKDQIVYVEGAYNEEVNKVLSEKYDEITETLKLTIKKKYPRIRTFNLLYLPNIAQQVEKSGDLFSMLLSYYYPNAEKQDTSSQLSAIPQTASISRKLLPDEKEIKPGLLRYIDRDKNGRFIYEYFQFSSDDKYSIEKQINHYISKINFKYYSNFCKEDEEEEKEEEVYFSRDFNIDREGKLIPSVEMHYRHRPPSLDEEDEESKEYRILKKIKTDIQYLIDLGFYEVLLKEVGDILFNEKEKTIQPSRLLIDDDFKIFLPDFDNLEIEMKPLPKALFFLFLRHPNGIHLKSLIDYRFELMDIYQMLSYRESLSTMNNSIDRLCSPIDGSINEKLSRIKEAFLKKTSIDAAMHYIVKGERGMKKNIELDRSLVSYPNSLMEIELTVIKDTLNK